MGMTLAILAAGMGMRYGVGIKQLDPVGPDGELIIDYSIHDAVQVGFDRILLIIRPEIYDDVRTVIGDRLERKLEPLGVELAYGFQRTDDLPAGRRKPWGTGQALLSCRDQLQAPFAVINSDDYYGKSAFRQAYRFLSAYDHESPDRYGMVAFVLNKTLSDSGGVTRGICTVQADGYLADICETKNIVRTSGGAGVVDGERIVPLDPECLVSMNMWMLTPEFVGRLEPGFAEFRAGMKDPLNNEYLLPTIIGECIQTGQASVKVLQTEDEWFGMTYLADKPKVKAAIEKLIMKGVYSRKLFDDLAR